MEINKVLVKKNRSCVPKVFSVVQEGGEVGSSFRVGKGKSRVHVHI